MVVGQPRRSRQLELRRRPIRSRSPTSTSSRWRGSIRTPPPGFNPIVVDDVMYTAGPRTARSSRSMRRPARRSGSTRGSTASPSRGDQLLAERGRQGQAADLLRSTASCRRSTPRPASRSLTFGENGIVDLRNGLARAESYGGRVQSNSPGKVWKNLLILGSAPGEAFVSPPGDIRAYDVITGKKVWQFHTVPLPGEFGYETWPKDAYKYVGGANNWGSMSVDDERGHRLHPARIGDLRFLRRGPHRRESVRQLPPRARRAHRQAAVALPDGASRSVGSRQRVGAAARHGAAQRPARRRRRARRQDRLPLRLQSRDRRAAVADRGAARCRRATCRASRPGRRSRSRPSRRRSSGRRSRWTTSIRGW